MKKIIVPEVASGERLDVFMAKSIPLESRAAALKLIGSHKVSVNNQLVNKAGQKLRPNDEVEVDYDFASKPQAIDLPVLFENDDSVVINKPSGVLSHSKGAFNPEATVASWMHPKLQGLSGERAGIVHRLDRATSGVMILAKNPESLQWLQKQFSQRRVKKTYKAIVCGIPKVPEAVIDMPIERNPKAPATFRVGANGKVALTRYRIEKTNQKYTLLELKPETGRTHQLRVHLKQLGHPIVGDTFYGGEPAERLLLHAASLELTLLGGERRTFTAKLPKVFQEYMRGREL